MERKRAIFTAKVVEYVASEGGITSNIAWPVEFACLWEDINARDSLW